MVEQELILNKTMPHHDCFLQLTLKIGININFTIS
jgi:hypothetical protein